jgi:hypothetical protein
VTRRRRPRAGYGPWLLALLALVVSIAAGAVALTRETAATTYREPAGRLLLRPALHPCQDTATGAGALPAATAGMSRARRADGPARLGYGEAGAAGVLAASSAGRRSAVRRDTCVAGPQPIQACAATADRIDRDAEPHATRRRGRGRLTISATTATTAQPSASLARVLDGPRTRGDAPASACSCSSSGVVPASIGGSRSATAGAADVAFPLSARDLTLLGLLVLGLVGVSTILSRRHARP